VCKLAEELEIPALFETDPLISMVELLTLLLRIQEFPGSNLGSETSYPD
jgi:hypothetical protein